MGSFRPNHIKFLLQDTEELSLMTPKSDEKLKSKIFSFNEKFKEKLTRSFKYDMRNLVNFHPTTLKISSLKISFWWALFVQSIQGLSYKNTEELSFMTLSSDAKFAKTLNLRFQKRHEELG